MLDHLNFDCPKLDEIRTRMEKVRIESFEKATRKVKRIGQIAF